MHVTAYLAQALALALAFGPGQRHYLSEMGEAGCREAARRGTWQSAV
jgi:hypothetical protein